MERVLFEHHWRSMRRGLQLRSDADAHGGTD
jgi:hypothetical protein